MRILFVTGAYPPTVCGVGDYTAQLVKHLQCLDGVTPGVLTSKLAGEKDSTPNFFPEVECWNVSSYKTISTIVSYFKPDLIHLQYPASFGNNLTPNFLPISWAIHNIPVVQTWHEPPIATQLINALPADNLIVVDSQYPKNYSCCLRFLVRRKKVSFIPIGSNIPRVALTKKRKNEIRERFQVENHRLFVFFGFMSRSKGAESLFEIADANTDSIILLCDLNSEDPYQAKISRLANSDQWRGKCFVTGNLPAAEVAEILASADAAVFPFTTGATPRNGSVLAARNQGTFVVTTHNNRRGYDATEHVFYVTPGDTHTFRLALKEYAGTSFNGHPNISSWEEIAAQHLLIYQNILSGQSATMC